MSNEHPICLAQDINLNLFTFKSNGGSSEYKKKVFYSDDPFTYKHLMMIDVLTTLVFHRVYNNSDHITFREYMHSKNIKKVKHHKPKVMSVEFTDTQLKKALPCIYKLTKTEIFEIILELSDNRLQLKYPKITYNDKYSRDHYRPFSNLFTLNKHDKVGKHREYKLTFDTQLGKLLINNVLYSHHSIVLEKFYHMSGNTQLLYRYLILPYWGTTKKALDPNDVKARLNLKSEGYELVKRRIPRMLQELIDYGMLAEFWFDPTNVKFDYKQNSLKYQRTL